MINSRKKQSKYLSIAWITLAQMNRTAGRNTASTKDVFTQPRDAGPFIRRRSPYASRISENRSRRSTDLQMTPLLQRKLVDPTVDEDEAEEPEEDKPEEIPQEKVSLIYKLIS